MNLDDLRPEDFDTCFTGEPAGPIDTTADLARGRAALLRRRILLGSTGVGVMAIAVVITGLQPVLRFSAEPASPTQPRNPDPAVTPSNATSSSSSTSSNPPFTSLPAGGGPVVLDPSGRSWLLPPDANRRLYYSGNISDPPPRSTKPRISKTRALAIAAKAFSGLTPGDDEPAIALRMISSDSDKPDVNGVSRTPRLFWVVLQPVDPNLTVAYGTFHTKPGANLEKPDPDQQSCRMQAYVNAHTGRAPAITQTCVRR